MASKAFLAALRKKRETNDLDSVLRGSAAKFLPEGVHDVVIQSVDGENATEKNYIRIEFAGEGGKSHTESLFLMDYRGEEFSFAFRSFLAATIPDTGAIDQLFAHIESGDKHAFEVFTGMKLRITLERDNREGRFIIKSVDGGNYIGVDVSSGNPVTKEHESVDDAKAEAEAQGLRRAFIRITRQEATHAADNIQALNLAVESRKKAKGAAGAGGGNGVSGGVVTGLL